MEDQLKAPVQGVALLQQILHHTDLGTGKDQMDIAEFLINHSLENGINDFRVSKGTQIGIFINHNHEGTRKRIEIGKYVNKALERRGKC